MKTQSEIYQDLRDRFEELTGQQPGSVLDFYMLAQSENDGNIYSYLEANKTPHVWTSLEGDKLDATGTWVNIPRDTDESDSSYLYRLMNWECLKETSNTTAIQTALLNPTSAANIEFVPMTYGCGTGTCYVLPQEYITENIAASLAEAKERMASIASPVPYIEYIVPEIKSVSFEAYLSTTDGDEDTIKSTIEEAVKTYVNGIAPKEYLLLGDINKIGQNLSQVEYFNIVSFMINNVEVNSIKALQELDSKFIFDSITWTGDSGNATI